jgi:hypothetical protein
MVPGGAPDHQPIVTIPIEFYRGVKAIAAFLDMTERHARRLLNSGKLPAKRDEAGRWVLTNLDYYQSLQG